MEKDTKPKILVYSKNRFFINFIVRKLDSLGLGYLVVGFIAHHRDFLDYTLVITDEVNTMFDIARIYKKINYYERYNHSVPYFAVFHPQYKMACVYSYYFEGYTKNYRVVFVPYTIDEFMEYLERMVKRVKEGKEQ